MSYVVQFLKTKYIFLNFVYNIQDGGAKTTTFEISVTLKGDIAQYYLTSHCVVCDRKFSCNGTVEYSILLVCRRHFPKQ